MAIFAFSGCTQKSIVTKDDNGDVVSKTVYIGLITKREYSKEVIDKAYNIGKGAYIVGKEIVINNKSRFDEDTLSKLSKIDDVALKVNEAKSIVDNMGKNVK